MGEASADEEKQVKEWIAADAANRAYFEQLEKVWNTSRQLAASTDVDENKAWERFQQRIRNVDSSPPSIRSITFPWRKLAAAVILILALAGLGYWFFQSEAPVEDRMVMAQQLVMNDTLPDGSVVTLNKRSSISYPSRFRGDSRPIVLKGEAFFHITPDKKKPFIISVNDVQITVVGTSFNVREERGSTEVIVETGTVRVTKAGKTVELTANERVTIPQNDGTVAKEQVADHLYNYYRTKEFVCDDTPLWKLVDVLNEAYSTHIVIGRSELRDLRMNTTFNNESLDQVLNVISLTFNIKITRTSGQIILQ